jgi:hypothetical protein
VLDGSGGGCWWMGVVRVLVFEASGDLGRVDGVHDTPPVSHSHTQPEYIPYPMVLGVFWVASRWL